MSKFGKNSRQITDRQEITDLLLVAQLYRWVLSYSPVGSENVVSHTTELVGMDGEANSLTVSSEVKYSGIEPGESILFRAQSGGINIRFESSIIQVGGNVLSMRLFSDCRIEFPESVTVNQLRGAVRVNFMNLANIPVTYFTEAGYQLGGLVEDLSTTGAKISFRGNLKYQFKASQIISDCKMMLPDKSNIDTRIKVLGFVYNQNKDVSYIRCQFLEMSEDSVLLIKELIDRALKNAALEVAVA